MIPIATNQDSTLIPITIFNGSKNGKTLGITAGVHGYEYTPILAAQRLIKVIDPQKLQGVVILVQIAGLESFLGRSPYVSPVDKKNLNRSFPGNSNGTNTEKVANFISEQIIAKSNYFLDMHSGDAPEDLISYAAYYSNSKMPESSSTGKEMAIALGFDYIVNFDTDKKDYIKKSEKSLYCTAEAFKRGIPSIDIECGRLGIIEEDKINKVEQSVSNLLHHLHFLPDTKKAVTHSHTMITNRIYLSAKFDGIFYPTKKAGDFVKKGMKLGHITDYFGETIQSIYAPEEGLILMIINTPPINKDEDLVVIGKTE
ncbi:M14 family metallopeptidase [Pedobacter sp. N23S346]|uniref:M14 family metallopeptidase n=1 Tax=Pedobacter sp. N23S346 TaxID=3402750 RepID=UPI003ACE2620